MSQNNRYEPVTVKCWTMAGSARSDPPCDTSRTGTQPAASNSDTVVHNGGDRYSRRLDGSLSWRLFYRTSRRPARAMSRHMEWQNSDRAD
jgi:hypothetical protein